MPIASRTCRPPSNTYIWLFASKQLIFPQINQNAQKWNKMIIFYGLWVSLSERDGNRGIFWYCFFVLFLVQAHDLLISKPKGKLSLVQLGKRRNLTIFNVLTYSLVQHFSLPFPPFNPFIHLFLLSSKFITSLKLIITAWMYIYVYTNIFPTITYSVTCWHVLRIVWYCTANRYAVPWKRPLLFLLGSRKWHHFYIK